MSSSPRPRAAASAGQGGHSWVTGVGAAQDRIRAAAGRTDVVLDRLVHAVSELVDAPATVALLEDGELVRRASTGDGRLPLGVRVETDGTACGEALRRTRPVRVGDADGHATVGTACCPQARSTLSVPLAVRGTAVGVVALTSDRPDWFDGVDENTVTLVAEVAADVLLAHLPPRVTPRTAAAPATAASTTAPAVAPPPVPAARVVDVSGPPASVTLPEAGADARPAVASPGRAGAVSVHDDDATVLLPAVPAPSPPLDPALDPAPPRPVRDLSVERTPELLVVPDGDGRDEVDGDDGLGNGLDDGLEDGFDDDPAPTLLLRPVRDDAADDDLDDLDDVLDVLDDPAGPDDLAPDDAVDLRGTADVDVRGTAAPAATLAPTGLPLLGLWQWDAATGLATLSDPVEELLGLPPGRPRVLGAVRALVHPDDVERVEQAVRDAAAPGGTSTVACTFRIVRRDGTERTVQVWGDVHRNRNGLVGAVGAVAEHVGARAGAAVPGRSAVPGADGDAEEVALLRAVRELTGCGVWSWRPDEDVLEWSPEMFRLVGLEPGEVVPTLAHWHGFVHAEDLDRARRLDAGALGRSGGHGETFRVVGADGTVRHVQSWSEGVPDDATDRVVRGAALDVTRQVHDRVRVERLASTDPVTGLGNRTAFERRVADLLAGPGVDVALLLLDVDRFKQVNDSLGHDVGDRLLVEVARRLTAVVPEDTLVARMGGDEFVVLPRPGLGLLAVRRLAEAVTDALRMPYVVPDSGELLVCPVSLGVTTTSGRAVSPHDLLAEAELALYRAKDSGRDRFVVYDEALRARSQSRHRAERLLRSALEHGRLALQYQPIVDFAHGRVVGAEALVRIRDESGDGLLPPDLFIDVAEDTGLVVDLDRWVIDTAIDQVERWARQVPAGQDAPWLSVNVSARSMEHPGAVRGLLDAVRLRRVASTDIKVELTERSFLAALPGGEGSLRQLLGSGIPVGIDDFGTGYSALGYLQRFDLDFMKIDRSFVEKVGEDQRADAVVTAIVDLAHAHGMLVTAEGVETARQARRLREIGCDLAQGYHFGRPADAARILAG